MDIPLRTEAPRRADTEPRNSTGNHNAADACGFGDLFAEVRQRDSETDKDRDTPPPGTEAAFAAQTAPVQPRQPTPAAEPADAEATDPAPAAGAVDGLKNSAAESAAPAVVTAASNSPENFAALLESTANALPVDVNAQASMDALATTAGLNATNAAMPAAPAIQTPPPVNVTVAPPLHSQAWPAAFNNTIRVLVSDQTQVARLQLTPGDLGPVDVRIAISEHRAEIAFAVSSPEAKAAIQQALPQLRETFAASGLELGDASFGESQRGAAGDPSNRGSGASDGLRGSGETAALLPPARAVGLIDLYA